MLFRNAEGGDASVSDASAHTFNKVSWHDEKDIIEAKATEIYAKIFTKFIRHTK
jgi:hypothetical protein